MNSNSTLLLVLIQTSTLWACSSKQNAIPAVNTSESNSASAHIDKQALQKLVRESAAKDTDALIVLHKGEVVLEKWFDGEPRLIESMSITKSISGLAIGRLITMGKIESMDVPLHRWFPQWKNGPKSNITLRHLLEQSTGIAALGDTSAIYDQQDYVQFALDADLREPPGTRFFYNNKATNLIPAVVRAVSAKTIDAFLKDEVFTPLGIEKFEWGSDPSGNRTGMSGFRVYPKDLAKLGQLMLNNGQWRGATILDPKWVEQATAPSQQSRHHGFLWWLDADLSIVLDQAMFDAWKAGGASDEFLSALSPLKDEVMAKDFFPRIGAALKDLGGLETWYNNTWRKGLADGPVVRVDVTTFRGDGWQGQHLLCLPQKNLVVLRMREPSEGNTVAENQKYSFAEIKKLAESLVIDP